MTAPELADRLGSRQWRRDLTSLHGRPAAPVVAPLLPPDTRPDILLAAADAAGQQVDVAADAAYWHVTSEVDYPNTEPFQREIWQGSLTWADLDGRHGRDRAQGGADREGARPRVR